MGTSHETLDDAAVEAAFNPRVAVPDFESHLAAYAARSDAARARLEGRYDLAYGKTALQTLDVFPARSGQGAAPLHVFIHGGYWRGLDKSDHSFIAEPLVAAGATAVLVNYDLCPAVTVDDIVAQVRAAIAWCHRHGQELGGDPARLFVSGHSAGAHLALMAMAHDWPGEGLPEDAVKGVVALSGVYDLAPVLRISVNAEIGLTGEMARRNSPMLHPPGPVAPLLVAVGADEAPAWRQQSVDLAAACRGRGVDCTFMSVPDAHHFSVPYALADPEAPLCRAVLAQMELVQ